MSVVLWTGRVYYHKLQTNSKAPIIDRLHMRKSFITVGFDLPNYN